MMSELFTKIVVANINRGQMDNIDKTGFETVLITLNLTYISFV